MAKINLNGLGNKIYMRDMSTILGLGGATQAANLNEILLAARCNKLPIYFDQEVFGAKISDGVDPIVDENGDVTKVMVNGNRIHTGSNQSTYLTGQGFDHKIMVSSFSHKGEDYYPTDETGMWLEHTHIYAIHFYCLKKELLASGLVGRPASSRKKIIKRQQQREKILMTWLAAKSGITITDPSHYQECYTAIKEPTQKFIWNELAKIEPSLFNVKRGEFFKHQKIIRLKTGTGSNR